MTAQVRPGGAPPVPLLGQGTRATRNLRPVHGFAYAAIWEGIAEIAPERVAIACGPEHLTFGDFDARADRVARVLAEAGLEAGDKVAIELVNGPAYLEVFYGALKLGCVPVNVNYRYVDAELVYLLDNAEARALVFHSDFAATVATALPKLTTPPAVLLRVEREAGPGARSTRRRTAGGVANRGRAAATVAA